MTLLNVLLVLGRGGGEDAKFRNLFSRKIDNRPFGGNTFLGLLASSIQNNFFFSYGITGFIFGRDVR